MKIVWTPAAWEDYLHWQANDQKVLDTINELIRDIRHDPFRGLGKPEPLKHTLAGFGSRRITLQDRLVYRVTGKGAAQQVEIVQCRYHY